MILSAQTIRRTCIDDCDLPTFDFVPLIHPFSERTTVDVSIAGAQPGDRTFLHSTEFTASYGLSACGYDVRLDGDVVLWGGHFTLGSIMERICMPDDVVGVVHDKSTWMRRGVAINPTVIEPRWYGHLTIGLTNHTPHRIDLRAGTPIAQILFHRLDQPTAQPYGDGKYQDQARGPQGAK